MCGIAGVHDWMDPILPDATVRGMTRALARRGPDGEGIRSAPGVAFGHRRLAIIDLSERGRQPMTNEDGSIWLTVNGEIYNYRGLRSRLEQQGHRFSSDTDSEVLVHLYEQALEDDDWTQFLESVRGMFAFGLWDAARRRLVLGRDRVGIKPLFYHLSAHAVAFASDLDGLTACPDVPRRLDWTSLLEYLQLLTVPEPNTIYRNVSALAPGTLLIVESGRVRHVRYWSLDRRLPDVFDSQDAADEALESVLSESVKLHLVADVEVGAFLSGGVDSGLVTSLAAHHADRRLRTFSATFPGEAADEGVWARDAAEQLGTTHTELPVTGGFLDGLERFVDAIDQPLALTSAVSLFHLSRVAREHVKVVLTGDGGDELFGGYQRHQPYPSLPFRFDELSPWLRTRLGRAGTAMLGASQTEVPLLRRARAFSSALARDEAELYVPRVWTLGSAAALALMVPDAVNAASPDRYIDRVRRAFNRCPVIDPLNRRLSIDIQTSLVDEMLTKVDRMTMACGLEARVPFLDHHVVEVAMAIPEPFKRTGKLGKRPLRRLLASRLGHQAAERPKSGFNSPFAAWIRREPRTMRQLDELWPEVERVGVFDVRSTRELKAMLSSAAGSDTATTVFALMVFALWARGRGLLTT